MQIIFEHLCEAEGLIESIRLRHLFALIFEACSDRMVEVERLDMVQKLISFIKRYRVFLSSVFRVEVLDICQEVIDTIELTQSAVEQYALEMDEMKSTEEPNNIYAVVNKALHELTAEEVVAYDLQEELLTNIKNHEIPKQILEKVATAMLEHEQFLYEKIAAEERQISNLWNEVDK